MASAVATNGDIATTPNPDHITLLLKHHKSTVLLSVPPNESFDTIKSHLLAILAARAITTLPGTAIHLPSSPDDIELGVFKDKRDKSKGWKLLESKGSETATTKSGKSKASKKTARNDTPEGAGLVDGSAIAYRVRAGASNGDDDAMEIAGWDVVLPTYEDEPDGEEDIDPA